MHYVDDLAPGADLVPPRGDAARTAFYRWAVFIVAALYPTFTYGDEPGKWVSGEGCAGTRESTDRHREALWLQLEQAAGAPWFLGERASALDLYLAVMTRWRPGAAWFAQRTPRIAQIAQRAAALDAVAPVIARNFAEAAGAYSAVAATRWCSPLSPASSRSAAALSVASQVNSGSSRPKWP